MGFSTPSPAPAPAPTATIPVVTDSEPTETKAAYEQTAARRRGLLSTLLSRRTQPAQDSPAANTGNPTLG
ncbi:MAG: hypothetical protein MJ058_04935 [Akkermansia sp.]|nr:hypothetical protein [Akkermansia sp.]